MAHKYGGKCLASLLIKKYTFKSNTVCSIKLAKTYHCDSASIGINAVGKKKKRKATTASLPHSSPLLEKCTPPDRNLFFPFCSHMVGRELPCSVFLSSLATANGQNESSELGWASHGPPGLVRDRPCELSIWDRKDSFSPSSVESQQLPYSVN